jgi:ABC-type antimicrobial peptide transport system permease subunit
MFRNYFKTAIRNLWRNKIFSVINILGLSLGMAASLLIFLWVSDEYSIDAFHKNSSNIYVVYEREFSDGKVNGALRTQGLLAGELKKITPEIEYASGFDNWLNNSATFSRADKLITMNGAAADTDFFKIFDYKLLQGNPGSILRNPDEIVISRRMAESFFGSAEAAMNKTIRYNDNRDFRIAAVFENMPAKSTDQFDYILNWQFHLKDIDWLSRWIYRTPKTYLTLRTGTDPSKVEAKIKNFLSSYIAERKTGGYRLELGLQRFDEMYLYSNFKNGIPSGGRIVYVRLFSIIAVFILLIACINFMNLSTARSVKRAKEVGVRKTIGALRSALIIQFIGEAIIFAFSAIVIAIVLVMFILPVFNSITGKQIVLPVFQVSFWIVLLSLVLAMGFIAGSYPALFLSSLNPVRVLKGSLRFSFSAVFFRKGLVVFQFALSIILIIGTMVISRQIDFVQTQNLGFNRENLVYVPFQGDMAVHKYSVFKQELSGMPGIKAITRADEQPTTIHAHVYDTQWEGKDPDEKTIVIHTTVGYGYLKLMNLQLLQGLDFPEGFKDSDSLEDHAEKAGFIINESLLRLTGYKNPIGKPLEVFGGRGKIIGVVKDFHFNSLHNPIQPLVILLTDNLSWGYAIIRTEPGKTKEAIASIGKVYKELEPKFPFTYSFADAEYQRLYESEQIVGRLSSAFAFLAIFISCLGILGLVMFTAEQRAKEIGIRKVLGASEIRIFGMLSSEFIQLVGIAFVIASPIAWLITSNWLKDYAYRVTVSFWLFAGAGVATVLIALITVSFEAVKAALANPVKSLRTD